MSRDIEILIDSAYEELGPPGQRVTREEIEALLSEGWTKVQVAEFFGVSHMTIYRRLHPGWSHTQRAKVYAERVKATGMKVAALVPVRKGKPIPVGSK